MEAFLIHESCESQAYAFMHPRPRERRERETAFCGLSAACPFRPSQTAMRDEEFQALKAAKKAAKRAKNDAGEATPEKKQRIEETPKDEEEAVAAMIVPVPKASASSTTTASSSKEAADAVFSDLWPSCLQCGEQFLFSAAEQSFFQQKGFASKTRCAKCTAEKKARFGETSGKGTAAAKRAAATTCYTCGQLGHSSKQCPQAPCFNCKQLGHKSKDCPKPRNAEAGVCFKFQSGSCTRGDACRFAHIKE